MKRLVDCLSLIPCQERSLIVLAVAAARATLRALNVMYRRVVHPVAFFVLGLIAAAERAGQRIRQDQLLRHIEISPVDFRVLCDILYLIRLFPANAVDEDRLGRDGSYQELNFLSLLRPA